jgi:hypothetical protein
VKYRRTACLKCNTELLTVFSIQSVFDIGIILEMISLPCYGGDRVIAGERMCFLVYEYVIIIQIRCFILFAPRKFYIHLSNSLSSETSIL